jgi:hypothetical protein
MHISFNIQIGLLLSCRDLYLFGLSALYPLHTFDASYEPGSAVGSPFHLFFLHLIFQGTKTKQLVADLKVLRLILL